jgi:hypothetical protein
LDPPFDWAYKVGGMVVTVAAVMTAMDIKLTNTESFIAFIFDDYAKRLVYRHCPSLSIMWNLIVICKILL